MPPPLTPLVRSTGIYPLHSHHWSLPAEEQDDAVDEEAAPEDGGEGAARHAHRHAAQTMPHTRLAPVHRAHGVAAQGAQGGGVRVSLVNTVAGFPSRDLNCPSW
eukprot:91228-Prorocentrum_minimum.AAC.2